MKQIYDPIHGYIEITRLMLKFIDTMEFQRLRDLKQLGATFFVFPSGSHTRFEHSIGVSQLAKITIESLKKNHPEMKITDEEIENVRLAGLLHDIGHGPFSHLYDDYVRKDGEPEHEERGIAIIRNMVEKYKILMDDERLEKIINMIDPSEELKNNWLYQIVANKICSVDVDKMDYIQRDSYHIGLKFGGEYERLMRDCRIKETSDGNKVLAWPRKLEFQIFTLFHSRYRLHKQVLSHHTVKAYEYLIIEILREMINDEADFMDLTDSVVFYKLNKNNLYKDLREKMNRRQTPKLVEEIIIPYTKSHPKFQMLPKRMVDFLVDKVEIGFASGGKNPLECVYYFDENKKEAYQVDPTKLSFCVPNGFRESVLRLYTYDNSRIEEAKKFWEILLEGLELR